MTDVNQWELLQKWIGRSSKIFIKKLSRNDYSWADDPKKNQNGFYVPQGLLAGDFFLALGQRTEPDKGHILMSEFTTEFQAVQSLGQLWVRIHGYCHVQDPECARP